MTYSERIANSTHFGIGVLPDSQRATVAREIPKADARPVCVSPASVLRVTRVSEFKLRGAVSIDFLLPAGDAEAKRVLLTAARVAPIPPLTADRANPPRFERKGHLAGGRSEEDLAAGGVKDADFGSRGESSHLLGGDSHGGFEGLGGGDVGGFVGDVGGDFVIHFLTPCLDESSVSPRYNNCNNLYQTRVGKS